MTPPSPREIFAASEIAQAINWDKRRVQTALAATPRAGLRIVGGNEAPAWGVASLPETLLREIERMRTTHYQRTAADVLRNPTKPWTPRTPLAQVHEDDRRKAERLQSALAVALALPRETSLVDRARAAATGFQREFGYEVSERRLTGLLARVLDRDRGARAWHRTELYLADNPRRKENSALPSSATAFEELSDEFSVVENPLNPTPADRAYCWRKIIEFYELRAAAGGAKPSRLKRELCAFLLTAVPFLGESGQAMKRNLNRKLAIAVQEGVEGIVDQRTTNSGRRDRPEDWEENIQLFARWTLTRHGRESQAWRELQLGTTPTGEQFSLGFREFYGFDVRHAKSRVPATARAAIRPIIIGAAAHQLGPRAARLARPSIPRDWSDTAAGDYFTADDVTINHLWFEWHDSGEYEFDGQRFNVGRGQWLICCDERTDLPLGFLLIPRPTYNAADICTLNAKIFSNELCGLPRRGMKYEQAIWKARSIAAQFSWSKIHDAFARQEVQLGIRHATTPRAKIVERLIGSAQNMMDHLPGYIGRCEAKVKFEREQKFLQSLKRVGQPRKEEVDPRQRFLGKEEISDEIAKVLRVFSEEPQNGERLAGLSPKEAWTALSPNRPRTVLPDSLRYLLTTNQSEQTVTDNGVRLKIGSEWHHYFGSERLGELRGEKVRVFYNPELPEIVSVIHQRSDAKGANPFSVPLFQRLPANSATSQDFARANEHRGAFSKFGKSSFRLLAPPSLLTIRNERLGTPELRETGDQLADIERGQRTLRAERNQRRGVIAKLSAKQNLSIDPAKVRNPERVAANLERADELEEEIRRMENAAPESTQP